VTNFIIKRMKHEGTILAAEDEDNDAIFLKHACKKAGLNHRLVHVHNGGEAIDYLTGVGRFADRHESPLPDLLLLDIDMPILTGFGVLEWLQAHPEFRDMPVIALTDSIPDKLMHEAVAMGAKECVVKPASIRELAELLKQWDERWLQPALTVYS